MNSQKETIRLERLTFDLKNVIKEFKDSYSDEFNNTKTFNLYTKENIEETTEYKKIIHQSETYRLSDDYILQHHTLDGETMDYFLVYDCEIVMYSSTDIGELTLTANPQNEKETYIVRNANNPIVDTLFYPIDYDLLELFRNNKVKKNKKLNKGDKHNA